jgi:hypothetical protein
LDELVQAGDALEQALKVARDYVQIPPKAYATVKCQSRQHAIEALKAEIAKSEGSGPVLWFNAETTSKMATMIGYRNGRLCKTNKHRLQIEGLTLICDRMVIVGK